MAVHEVLNPLVRLSETLLESQKNSEIALKEKKIVVTEKPNRVGLFPLCFISVLSLSKP